MNIGKAWCNQLLTFHSETEHSTMASIFDVTQVVPPSENQNENIF